MTAGKSQDLRCWDWYFFLLLLPLYQFLSSLTHGNWQPRISRRWPLRKGLYSLFHLIFMWWCNKLPKKCSTELCIEQTMCALFKSSLLKKKKISPNILLNMVSWPNSSDLISSELMLHYCLVFPLRHYWFLVIYRVFFLTVQKLTLCQTLRKFWH